MKRRIRRLRRQRREEFLEIKREIEGIEAKKKAMEDRLARRAKRDRFWKIMDKKDLENGASEFQLSVRSLWRKKYYDKNSETEIQDVNAGRTKLKKLRYRKPMTTEYLLEAEPTNSLASSTDLQDARRVRVSNPMELPLELIDNLPKKSAAFLSRYFDKMNDKRRAESTYSSSDESRSDSPMLYPTFFFLPLVDPTVKTADNDNPPDNSTDNSIDNVSDNKFNAPSSNTSSHNPKDTRKSTDSSTDNSTDSSFDLTLVTFSNQPSDNTSSESDGTSYFDTPLYRKVVEFNSKPQRPRRKFAADRKIKYDFLK